MFNHSDSNDLFTTKEEAEEYCKKMNKGIEINVDAVDDFRKNY